MTDNYHFNMNNGNTSLSLSRLFLARSLARAHLLILFFMMKGKATENHDGDNHCLESLTSR